MSSAPGGFVSVPKSWHVTFSTANSNRDGTGSMASLVSGASNGTRVDRMKLIGIGTVTAGMIRAFLSDGTNIYEYDAYPVTATVPSATVKEWTQDVDLDLVLPSGWSLRLATHNAEAFAATAHGGDL